ncbi:YpoC family protein [Parageobacillus thermoglucosidasius]
MVIEEFSVIICIGQEKGVPVMRVADEFAHPLFFREGEVIEIKDEQPFPHMMQHVYFYYDMIEREPFPWDDIGRSIPAVLQLWREEKEQLESCFARRDRRSARAPMIRALSYLLSCLFWLNGKKVTNVRHWQEEIGALPLKPVNGLERLQFIFERCDVYHSFIQLCELFEETGKLAYKQMAINKRMSR